MVFVSWVITIKREEKREGGGYKKKRAREREREKEREMERQIEKETEIERERERAKERGRYGHRSREIYLKSKPIFRWKEQKSKNK